MAVFPEGTRSRSDEVGLFKRGSFKLALSAGAPVVPLSLIGVRHVIPSGLLSLRSGRVGLRVHAAVPTDGCPESGAEILAAEVRRKVVEGCA